MKTVFIRLLEAEDKATALRTAIQDPELVMGRQRFEVDPQVFTSVPRSPFAYWVTDQLRQVFQELPRFETDGRAARQGGITGDDFRWLRLWYEVPCSPSSGVSYIPIAKGGRRAHYYGERPLVARWDFSRNTFHAFTGLPHRPSLQPASFPYYFRPGLTWPLRGKRFSAFAVPGDGIFSVGGKMAFAPIGHDPLPWLAIFNSQAFDGLIAFFAGTFGGVQYEVGLIQHVPVPKNSAADIEALSSLARRAWVIKRAMNTCIEDSHAFNIPALLQMPGNDLNSRASLWLEHLRAIEAEAKNIQNEIDVRCFELYGISDEDRRTIIDGFGGEVTQAQTFFDEEDCQDDDENDLATIDTTNLAAELVSWAVGVAFGRFDVRLATGTGQISTNPEPFDSIPAYSPGMLSDAVGQGVSQLPPGYPLPITENGVLVDDPGHAQDITTTVHAVFDVVFGASSDHWRQDVAKLLNPKDHDIRNWLVGNYFGHHLKQYSNSRRKAPIFWQLATPSGKYSVWIYAHRLTSDTFFQLQNQEGIVTLKLAHEERKLNDLIQSSGNSPSARERKEIALQESSVEELRAFLEEIRRVAPLWKPDLDDGVILTMAPLWLLVPQHKPWQKELKTKWTELCAGNHDWAHIAMHLWPERVVPKCTTDRSLAIAHGLEQVFWEEDKNGKWIARATPTRSIEELVRERSSPAVKAALKNLLDAPVEKASKASARSRSGR